MKKCKCDKKKHEEDGHTKKN